MYLAFNDIANLIPDRKGTIDENIFFYTVSDNANSPLSKGIFVPLSKESGELAQALANGAIAAIWNKNLSVPHYTPNQFPLFLTDDPAETVWTVILRYLEKLDGETDKTMKMTKFDFLTKKLLNKNNETYDIAVMLNKAAAIRLNDQQGRRG